MDAKLLDILACPLCKGTLRYVRAEQVLVCRADLLAYPVREDIPVMLEDEARQVDGNADIYFVERKGGGWSEPKPVSQQINSPAMERILCVIADGSLYFSRDVMLSREAMFVSRFVNGTFTKPEKLGKDYNSEAPELAMIFGPNQEYRLIAQMDDRSCYAYVSYENADGTWSRRIKTPYECGGFLSLSPDSKYLFFLGDGIFWVRTSFIEELRPKE